MESLSPECTPLKHRYDSCFNAWFEGYLQPALAAAGVSTPSPAANAASASTPPLQSNGINQLSRDSSSSSSSSLTTPVDGFSSNAQPPITTKTTPARKPLITSWASAFPSRPRRSTAHPKHSPSSTHKGDGAGEVEEHHWYDFVLPEGEDDGSPVDGDELDNANDGFSSADVSPDDVGQTRAQIKAEEYQRNCGKVWEDYQGCLKKAITQNESLSTLLETAREEHPLGRLDGLKGTPWDSKADFSGNDA